MGKKVVLGGEKIGWKIYIRKNLLTFSTKKMQVMINANGNIEH